jgi:hypothetical protein
VVVNLDYYKTNKQFVVDWFLGHKEMDINAIISSMAVSTSCPCIVVAYWVAEVNGYTPEVLHTIQSLKDFYGYDKIVGVPDSCPI